jgi:hypothetical protein
MQTKQSSYNIEEIKNRIIKDRLRLIFKERSKAVAKILTHIIKRQKSV